MSKFVARLQIALLERRTIQVIVWFVITGALLYLAAVFWFGWQDTMAAFAVLGLCNADGLVFNHLQYSQRIFFILSGSSMMKL